MDQFLSMGKEAFSAYQQSQGGNNNNNNNNNNSGGGGGGGGGGYSNAQGHQASDGGQFGVQGSAALNSYDNQRPSGQIDLDHQQTIDHAMQQSGGGDSSLFAQAMRFAQQHAQQGDGNHHIDEQAVQDQHDQAYNQGNGSSMGAQDMGSAAAMQALKMFTSGGGNQASGGGGGGDMKSMLMAKAMAEASNLFDQSGGASSGSKQDAVNSAGQMMMKLMLKQQMGSMMGGGGASSGGGLSSLMGMASKFM